MITSNIISIPVASEPELIEMVAAPRPLIRVKPNFVKAAKRIAIVTPAFGSFGGLTSWASFLFKAIQEYSQDNATIVSVATSRNDAVSRRVLNPASWVKGPTVKQSLHDGISFVHVGSALAEVEPARYWPHKALNTILNAADVVLIVSGTPVWAFLASQSGKPILLQTASLAAWERERRLRVTTGAAGLWTRGMTDIVSKMEPHALRQATRVFVLNRDAEERVADIVGRSRVERAAVGVDVTTFSPAASYSDDGYLLAVGRMNDPRKNFEFLLRSYATLRAQMPSAPRLVIAGEPLNSGLMRLVEAAGLRPFVHFVHNATQDQLVSLYQNASLLLIPSAEEGFGIVAVEAMACGIPVVATRCAGPEEVIVEGETGYLVSLDPDRFAATIMEALQAPSQRKQMGAAGRSVAVERYSIRAAAAPYLTALSQL